MEVTTTTYQPDPNSTLAYIREKLQREKDGTSTRDLSKLVKVEHRAAGIIFLVSGMNRADYQQWRSMRAFEEVQHKDAGRDKADVPIDRDRSDTILLQRAVLSSDGQQIDVDIAKWLLSGNGFGPSTQAVLTAAERENPPRGDGLNYDIALLMAKSQAEVMLWKLLFEAGLGRALIDFAAPSATDEEKAWASHQLTKAEETVADLGIYFDVEESARSYGISFREAALKKVVEVSNNQ